MFRIVEKGETMVQSVDRALMILDILKQHPKGLGITELAHELNVAKSTAHRLVSTLETYDYVTQDRETSRYSLGLKFLEMQQVVMENMDIVAVAHPILEALTEECGEISHLVMRDHFDVVYIDKVESAVSTIRIYSRTGKRAPIYCTAVGKAIAAHFDEPLLQEYVEQSAFQPLTRHTISEPEAFKAALQKVLTDGYAEDNEEHEEGIRCIGAPIFNHLGQVPYAISITGPLARMTDARLQTLIPRLKQAAAAISRNIGYRK
jgi:DNA-binding IclR family transcriptional regulator